MRKRTTQTPYPHFKDVVSKVKKGLSITESCKTLGISMTTFYRNIDQKELKVLTNARAIGRPVKNIKGHIGIPFFLDREDLLERKYA